MELLIASVLLGWLAIGAIVVGLCMAAARGDESPVVRTSRDLARFTPAGGDPARLPGDRAPL
jgi:hypothetical protein